MHILIVDDDATSRVILRTALRKLGHQVSSSSTGVEALQVFQSRAVPLLISDVLMPDLDGLHLCQAIRASRQHSYTYIILLTATGGKFGCLAGLQAGADDFITKPFDEDLLAARLVVAERLLNLQSQVHQLSGLLPICAQCKKVRDDQNYWHEVESYISQRTEARFSHGYCPACLKKFTAECQAHSATEKKSPTAR